MRGTFVKDSIQSDIHVRDFRKSLQSHEWVINKILSFANQNGFQIVVPTNQSRMILFDCSDKKSFSLRDAWDIEPHATLHNIFQKGNPIIVR